MYMDKRTISAYEHDKIDVKASVLKELSVELRTTAGYLIDGEVRVLDADLMQLFILFKGMKPEVRKVAVGQIELLSKLNQ